MPTYEYLCRHCGHKFEAFQSMTAQPLKKCPKCARRAVERLISAGAGLIFKGSGFYVTDYRRSSKAGAAKPEGGSDTSGSEPNKTAGEKPAD